MKSDTRDRILSGTTSIPFLIMLLCWRYNILPHSMLNILWGILAAGVLSTITGLLPPVLAARRRLLRKRHGWEDASE